VLILEISKWLCPRESCTRWGSGPAGGEGGSGASQGPDEPAFSLGDDRRCDVVPSKAECHFEVFLLPSTVLVCFCGMQRYVCKLSTQFSVGYFIVCLG